MSATVNISARLTEGARLWPDRRAIAAPLGCSATGRVNYRERTFAELDQESTAIAAGLVRLGVSQGTRLVLFVPFGIEFITLTFALFKAGAVVVLIDPGMGRTNIFNCLSEVQPEGFIAIPRVHLARWLYRRRFPKARFNVSVGRGWPGVISTYSTLRETSVAGFKTASTESRSPAAIIFTSGSTGPPKGVLYEHGMFDAQVQMIQGFYGIQAGEIDMPGFPLFGLFNAAMGVSTIIPQMDPTRPARVDPRKIVSAIQDQGVTQVFGSPAFWNRVGRYCVEQGMTLPGVRRALSAGGPVPMHVLDRMNRVLTNSEADLFTPYGATESLPVASIGAREVLTQTAAKTRRGAGTCVGRCFPGVEVRIIEIQSAALPDIGQTRQLPPREIGEIIVRSPSATREYFHRPEATRLAKINDGETFWHRMGDVGYLDEQGLLWFCGRKAHIVETGADRLFSVCCEAIFDEHPLIYRTALVGIGTPGKQVPVLVAEPEPGQFPWTAGKQRVLREELLALGSAHEQTCRIQTILFHRSLPVDTRHNVKINREVLASWAERRM